MELKIPLGSQSYQSESLPLSAQRCVNLYPRMMDPSAKVPVALFGTPGLKAYQEIHTGPLRGMLQMDHEDAPGVGYLFVVTGTRCYRVSSNGDTLLLGTVPGDAKVQMSHNGTQVAILIDTESTGLYIATTTTLTQVTDADYEGATSVDFIDGYFIFTKPESGEFFISGSYDGTTFDALDFATAEGDPDALRGLKVDHREVWLLGRKTIEVWYNSGEADFPFERISGAFIERGTVGIGSVAKLDNSLFWVGDDRIVYRADGYTPRRISTHPIEVALSEHASLTDLITFAYTQNGHAFYVMKKPDAFTFVYDVASNRWHERESHNRLDYRISTFEEAFNKLLVGDDTTGDIYELDPATYTENGETFTSKIISPHIWAEAATATMNTLVIGVENGVGLTSGQGSDPQMMMRYSDDGGRTWSNEKWRSAGKKGEYRKRIKYDRLGQFRQRCFELSWSDPTKRVIDAVAVADVEGGRL